MGRGRLENCLVVIDEPGDTDVVAPLLPFVPRVEPPDNHREGSITAKPPPATPNDRWGLDMALADASAHLTSAYEIIARLSSRRPDPVAVFVPDELQYAAMSAFCALAAVDHCSQALWLR
jgi:hypothetical protein